jgi:hypothetical protein
MMMTTRTHTLLVALMGGLVLATTAAAFADPGHGRGWGKYGYRYDPAPYGYISIQTAPAVVYAPPPAYYGPRYGYGYPPPPPRYAYPVAPAPYGYPLQPSFSFGMTIPID